MAPSSPSPRDLRAQARANRADSTNIPKKVVDKSAISTLYAENIALLCESIAKTNDQDTWIGCDFHEKLNTLDTIFACTEQFDWQQLFKVTKKRHMNQLIEFIHVVFGKTIEIPLDIIIKYTGGGDPNFTVCNCGLCHSVYDTFGDKCCSRPDCSINNHQHDPTEKGHVIETLDAIVNLHTYMSEFIQNNYKLFNQYTGVKSDQITNMINYVTGPTHVKGIPPYACDNNKDYGYGEVYDYYFMTKRRNLICIRHAQIYDAFRAVERNTAMQMANDLVLAKYDDACNALDDARNALDAAEDRANMLENYCDEAEGW